jgi:hypothetical protein
MSDDLLIKNVGIMKDVQCPFCGESDFDLIGLRGHLENGWCEIYESTPKLRPPL